MSLEANPASIAVGGQTSTITATVRDEYGNLVTDGTVVTFTTSLGSFPATPHTATTSDGVATATLTSGDTPGQATVTADAGTAQNQTTVEFTLGAPTTLHVEDAPDGSGSIVGDLDLTAGTSLTVYAITRDELGNFYENTVVTWSLTDRSGGVVDGDLTPAGDGRSATFTGRLVGAARIRADHATLGSDETGLISVTPGSLDSFGLDVPASGIAGQPFTMTITAQDLFGNTITNFAEDVSLSTPNGGIICPTLARAIDFAAGVWTGQVTLSEAGQDRIITVSFGGVSSQTTIDLASAWHKIFLPAVLRNY